uniref:Uncharacterized protein n=1 Tax=Oryza sativa subsp. japonica TaxID=39947 RepID=Q6Z9V5_ORYSJ|nr:hypothetical protein [Oryza sativa Japonica Group]BAC99620.1 hypothetical protein [Oryza sativa Japonica Group]
MDKSRGLWLPLGLLSLRQHQGRGATPLHLAPASRHGCPACVCLLLDKDGVFVPTAAYGFPAWEHAAAPGRPRR